MGTPLEDPLMSKPRVTVRPVLPADRFVIRRWLAEPHVEAWWGSRSSAEAKVTLALGSDSALCRIIEADGVAVGYAHAVDMGFWGGSWPKDLPAGSFDVDLFVGDKAHTGRGIGRQALDLLVVEVFQTTLALACAVVVSLRNEAAVRAYERADFRWVSIWDAPDAGPSWVMLRLRPDSTPPRAASLRDL